MTETVEPLLAKFSDGCRIVLEETRRVMTSLDEEDWNRAAALITGARSVFVIGNGRSGLAAQMAAMRLVHLGLRVHVVGETTAPAIGATDTLIAVSGSGTTPPVVRSADIARDNGADVVAITTAPTSPLAQRADVVVILPAADKQDHTVSTSRQYAGSLFEQMVLLAFDAQFHALWADTNQTAERLWARHANLG